MTADLLTAPEDPKRASLSPGRNIQAPVGDLRIASYNCIL